MHVSAKSPMLPLLAVFAALLAMPLQADPAAKSPAPAQEALTTLTANPTGPLPPGTRLLSVTISDGLATADFSRELRDNFHGGDTEEVQVVNAILKTLGQFPTVSKVQILVDGQHIDSLGGLLVLSDPLPVIRPAVPEHARYLHRRGRSRNPSEVASQRTSPSGEAAVPLWLAILP